MLRKELRKELENIANNEGLITDKKFLEKRSHIFWNLVRTLNTSNFKYLNSILIQLRYSKRIQVDSELPIVLLISKIMNDGQEEKLFTLTDLNRVSIKCLWVEL
jgi:hypothetical protein